MTDSDALKILIADDEPLAAERLQMLLARIEGVHLVGLTLLGSAALLVDLRLLGALFPNVPTAQLAKDARPWLYASVGVMLVTGILLFLSEAVKCFYNVSFWVKMAALAASLVFLFAVKQPLALRAAGSVSSSVYKAVGAISIALWLIVAVAGRWIGFS